MRDLILVRHGESEHHVANLYGGWTNSGLTSKGIKQAQATAEWLKRYAVQATPRIVSSDLIRAHETARHIGAAFGITAEALAELREMSAGLAEGLPRSTAETLRKPKTTPILDWIPFDGAESWRMMHDRVASVMDKVISNSGCTIVVGHGHSLICAVNWFLDFDEAAIERFMYRIDPCSITHLKFDDDGSRSIERLNDTAHLRDF